MNTEKKAWISDKAFFRLVLIVSIAVFAVVVLLQYLPADLRPSADFAKALPFTNATINSIVSILLIFGLRAIKSGNKGLHQKYMLGAFLLSGLFLVSYVTYHVCMSHTKHEGTGMVLYSYYGILLTHIVLAAAVLPMVLYTVYYSTTEQFAKHRKIAKITFPIWLYVSITGVVVYLMIAPYYPFKYFPF
ncbi:MAG: DUF420 domain-containing protein [Bacteroidota bacterium]|jgi:putative membrane protein